MRQLSVRCVGLAVFMSCSLVSASASAAATYSATLTGDQEVPPVDTDASGQARLLFLSGFGEDRLLTVRTYQGLSGPSTGAHIHVGPVGVDGPIVLDFANGSLIDLGFLAINLNTAADLEGLLEGQTLDDLRGVMDEGNAYVNLHTEENPGGEIRGQIEPPQTTTSPSAGGRSRR